MDRRGFLKTLAGVVVAAAAPALITARTLDQAEALSTRTTFVGGWHDDLARLHPDWWSEIETFPADVDRWMMMLDRSNRLMLEAQTEMGLVVARQIDLLYRSLFDVRQ